MTFVRVKTTVKYAVPAWEFCNCSSLGKPTKGMCRFCVKNGKKYICAMHNMPLDVCEGILVRKNSACIKATAGFKSNVEDAPQINPKEVMKLTMQSYRKTYRYLLGQGYPDAMADKLAQQMVLTGDN